MCRKIEDINKAKKLLTLSLRHYDSIGLLRSTEVTSAGYRMYDDTALERLQQIELLTLKKEHLDDLITLARGSIHKDSFSLSGTQFLKGI